MEDDEESDEEECGDDPIRPPEFRDLLISMVDDEAFQHPDGDYWEDFFQESCSESISDASESSDLDDEETEGNNEK